MSVRQETETSIATRLEPQGQERKKHQENLSSSDYLLLTLARITNPDTGKTYTTQELAELFRYPVGTVRKLLRETKGNKEQLTILEARHEKLPENEEAFFMGLAFGNYRVKRLSWSGRNFVAIGTKSQSKNRRLLLRKTIGTWGETRETPKGLVVYTESPTFDFMIGAKIPAGFLDAKTRFAPFLLGIMVTRLSDKMERLSLSDKTLLKRIHDKYINYFGYSMGNFHIEPRLGGKPLPTIQIKEPGRVFGSLLEVKSVYQLPFLKEIAKLSPASK